MTSRRFFIGFLLLISFFILQGCIDRGKSHDEDLEVKAEDLAENDADAKVEDLDGYYFDGGRYQLFFKDYYLLITGSLELGESQKSVFDDIFMTLGKQVDDTVFEEYENIIIETSGNQYTITVSDFSFELMKVDADFVVDAAGMEYVRNELH